jgi:acetylxylan esterase
MALARESSSGMVPRMSFPVVRCLFLTSISDTTLAYPNFQESIKQWTNVHSVSSTPTSTTKGQPSSQFTKTVYGDAAKPVVVGYSGQGVTHDIRVNADVDLAFFGI